MTQDRAPGRIDPRAVRVGLAQPVEGVEPIVVEPEAAGGTEPRAVRLERRGGSHALLVEDEGLASVRTAMVTLGPGTVTGGTVHREVIVDGWRFAVEIEPEQRASLRERARRGRDQTARTGRSELRAVIPGRVLSVSVAPGDPVTAGQQVMAIEAMKMQNELRAPRDGVVASVEVGIGRTVEVGDVLLVLE